MALISLLYVMEMQIRAQMRGIRHSYQEKMSNIVNQFFPGHGSASYHKYWILVKIQTLHNYGIHTSGTILDLDFKFVDTLYTYG